MPPSVGGNGDCTGSVRESSASQAEPLRRGRGPPVEIRPLDFRTARRQYSSCRPSRWIPTRSPMTMRSSSPPISRSSVRRSSSSGSCSRRAPICCRPAYLRRAQPAAGQRRAVPVRARCRRSSSRSSASGCRRRSPSSRKRRARRRRSARCIVPRCATAASVAVKVQRPGIVEQVRDRSRGAAGSGRVSRQAQRHRPPLQRDRHRRRVQRSAGRASSITGARRPISG